MKHVVITGSTRGIGFGLAKEFLRSGCNVTINGQSDESVQRALNELNKDYDGRVAGFAASIDTLSAMEKLWDYAYSQFGEVHIWINNAGIDQKRKYFWEMDEEEYIRVIRTNVVGMMNGCHVAFRQMQKQGHGYIYTMEGFGSNGMMREKMTLYGTSKSALTYFTKSLAIEAKNTNVKVGRLSPGMVATDFTRKSYSERSIKIFNILGDKVEPVTKFLVEKILENTENDAHICWLTKPKVMWRFLRSPFVKRDIFN